MTRAVMATTGREVLSSAERLMDGMLIEEQRCYERIAVGLGLVATQVEHELADVVREVGLGGIPPRVPDLLPEPAMVAAVVLPPVGDLLATARERTLVVLRRQLRAIEASVDTRWLGTAGRAVKDTQAHGESQEEVWFGRTASKLSAAVVEARRLMADQALTWWSRHEQFDKLVARWCSPDPVSLPGSLTRGALWSIRGAMTFESRNAAVALTNGLLLQGYLSWNDAVAPAEQ